MCTFQVNFGAAWTLMGLTKSGSKTQTHSNSDSFVIQSQTTR